MEGRNISGRSLCSAQQLLSTAEPKCHHATGSPPGIAWNRASQAEPGLSLIRMNIKEVHIHLDAVRCALIREINTCQLKVVSAAMEGFNFPALTYS